MEIFLRLLVRAKKKRKIEKAPAALFSKLPRAPSLPRKLPKNKRF